MSVAHSPEHCSDENGFHNSDDLHDSAFPTRSCCLWIPCLRSTPSQAGSMWWERIRSSDNNDDDWWLRGWRRIREWSEIVAGPKWKTFIRQFNKNPRNRQSTFRYDPLSYALNFDEGPVRDDPSSEDFMRRDFSARFAIPTSAKSSMDFGKDGHSFV